MHDYVHLTPPHSGRHPLSSAITCMVTGSMIMHNHMHFARPHCLATQGAHSSWPSHARVCDPRACTTTCTLLHHTVASAHSSWPSHARPRDPRPQTARCTLLSLTVASTHSAQAPHRLPDHKLYEQEHPDQPKICLPNILAQQASR